MRRSDFHFDLPDELIAQMPLAERTASRLLCLNKTTGELADKQFADIESLLQPNDLLVLNNTKVIKARLFGQKLTGGKLEVLVERVINEQEVLAHVRCSKSPKAGAELILEQDVRVTMLGREGELFHLRFDSHPVFAALEQYGHMPLPPYIEREDTAADEDRYQTVFAEVPGAVAAPTASLHFDEAMLARLAAKGVNKTTVTLHVGAGTFQPVRADDIRDHHMHAEWLEVTQAVVDAVAETKANGGRVIAVGTTAVRSLESAVKYAGGGEKLAAYTGETELFCYPGYEFKAIDGLITNFHLPESTLLMLVSALGGHQATMQAYRHAVTQRYRFFSYGDAMFIA